MESNPPIRENGWRGISQRLSSPVSNEEITQVRFPSKKTNLLLIQMDRI